MADANGSLKASRPAANPVNGAVKAPLNGRAVAHPARPATRPRSTSTGPGLLARTFSIAARLLTWYSISSILFRCPASLDACDDDSPRICKPYFQLKAAVAPHAQPHYDAYVAPYVDLAWPYYNAVDQRVIAPTWAFAQQYGAPHAERLQVLGRAQWEKTVQPQVEKYQALAKAQYDEKLAPHIDRASTALGPYLDIARTNSLQTYHGVLVPAFQYVQPHLLEGYRAASVFTGNTVVPAFVWTWNKTYTFLDGTVGPQIRAVYTETVEPQLVKIGKRLGRYSSTKKTVPKALTTDSSTSASTGTSSSFTKPAASVPVTSNAAPAPSVSAHHEQHDKSTDPARSRASLEPIPPPEVDEKLEQDDPNRRSAREIVAADLQDWQARYAKAADEGAAEIDERVQEIAKRMIRRNARITGKALLDELRNAAVSELVMLRRAILSVVGLANKERLTREEATEEVIQAVRQAGMAVREKAQAVRTWRESYENEVKVSVTKAAETHFTILENIRDLALQRIGMKWAWMDGVTYKDWAKYHLLKSRFDEWKVDLENHIVSHPSLEAAQLEAANIEDDAMKVASATAKELARLKQVANWKLIAADDTAEFDSDLMQQAAEAAEAAKVEAGNAPVDKTVDTEATDAAAEEVGEASEAVNQEAAQPFESEPLSEASSVSEESQTGSTKDESESAPEEEPVVPASEAAPEVQNDSEAAASSLMFETPVMVANATELPEEEVVTAEVPVQETPVEEENASEPVEQRPEVEDSEAQPAVEEEEALAAESTPSGAGAQPVDTPEPAVSEEEEEEEAPAL